jgi:PadR family transcriptional regulator PadR
MTKTKSLSLGAVMVLHALARGHRYGFDLIEETGLTTGTVYPTLERLQSGGLAESSWEDVEVARAEKRPARRYFEVTAEGMVELARALERYKALAPVALDGVVDGAEPA